MGFIGHNVVAFLEQQGHNVIITDTQTTYGIIPKIELDALIAERRRYIKTDRIYGVDIADCNGIAWLLREHRPSMVIHLASFPRQKVVNANPQLGSQTMSEGLLNLLEASVKHNVQKFVYVSSSMVYGDFKDIYFDGINESADCKPLGQYGIMKLAGEWLVQDYSQRTGMSHTIIRPSAVYGPRDVEDRVVSKFLLNAMRDQSIQVNGANEELDFTYVDDVALGIVQATVSENTTNKTYNLTRGQSRTLAEAAQLAVDIVGHGEIATNLKDAAFPSRGQLNTFNARRDFNYAPVVNIEEGFRLYYDWLKNNVYWSETAV